MKTLIYTILFFQFIAISKGQSWKEMENEFNSLLSQQSFDLAEQQGNKMLEKSKYEFGDTSLEFNSTLYTLSGIDYINRKDNESIKKLERAKVKYYNEKNKYSPLYYKILNDLGKIYYLSNKYVDAEKIFSELFQLDKTVPFLKMIYNILKHIAIMHKPYYIFKVMKKKVFQN
jgi:tetratricopeptide (TPR) repeat protein